MNEVNCPDRMGKNAMFPPGIIINRTRTILSETKSHIPIFPAIRCAHYRAIYGIIPAESSLRFDALRLFYFSALKRVLLYWRTDFPQAIW